MPLSPTVTVATPAEQPAAVRRLLPPPGSDHLLALLAQGAVSAEHLLVARRDGRLAGAAFAEVIGGGLAEVYPPAADDPATADALAVALLDRLTAAGVAVAQCLLSVNESAGPLVRAGFRHVTHLVTARREPAPVDRLTSILYIYPVSASDPDLLATFAATLGGSLDLPELSGARPPAVELAGYPAAERFLAALDGRPVGLSLLAPGEVLYLGLVPAARGRGHGAALLRHALTILGADTSAVTVAADGRNLPALRLYEGHGFRVGRSQDVYLWLRTNSRA